MRYDISSRSSSSAILFIFNFVAALKQLKQCRELTPAFGIMVACVYVCVVYTCDKIPIGHVMIEK